VNDNKYYVFHENNGVNKNLFAHSLKKNMSAPAGEKLFLIVSLYDEKLLSFKQII